VRGFICLTVRYVPKMLCHDYRPNVRSLLILLRSALLPNVACVVFWSIES
jgi:hypothetical protein